MAKFSRTIGPDKHFKPSGRVIRREGLYVGYVKDVADVQKMGRLRVWIPEFGSKEADESGWTTVSYSSPFAGATNPDLLGNNTQTPDGTQTSYGFWMIPPDLENQVLVMFANGDPTRGVAMGFLFQQFMNNMVPGVPAGDNYQFPQVDAPTSEYNKRTSETNKENIRRPALSDLAEGINAQGLIRDQVRGVTTASARRESPSQVYGILTPGPDNPDSPGKRLGGSQFYMDDNPAHEHIRIRTKGGAQLLIDETNGLFYAINKAGTGWIQMDAVGNFDIFGAGDVSVRAQNDINFRADNDIVMEAGRNITIKAAADKIPVEEGSLPIDTGAIGVPLVGEGGEIIIEAANDFTMTSIKGNMNTTVLVGSHDTTITGDRSVNIVGDDNLLIGGGQTMTTTGALNIGTVGGITMSTAGVFGVGSSNFNVAASGVGVTGNVAAVGNVTAGGDVKTSRVGLNGLQGHTHKIMSGSSAGVTGTYTGAGGGGTVVGPVASVATPAVPAIPTVPLPKINNLALFVPPLNDTRVQQPVLTMVGRFLTFEPCPEHENKGGQSGLPGL